MKDQNSVDSAASPKLQPMLSPASNDSSGQGPATDSSTGTPVSADMADQGGVTGQIEPDSVKAPHV
jgi:hypothetical protein